MDQALSDLLVSEKNNNNNPNPSPPNQKPVRTGVHCVSRDGCVLACWEVMVSSRYSLMKEERERRDPEDQTGTGGVNRKKREQRKRDMKERRNKFGEGRT